jgi:predicted ribosome quality control (RQC) complex YloA/Tae2 family protein
MVRFREFETTAGKIVLAGRNAKNNEELVAQVEEDEDVFHTSTPGSPFVNIIGKSNQQDRKEAAIFCASKSKAWRDYKKDIEVHWFKGKDIYKRKSMKPGTFGVKEFSIIKVKKIDIKKLEEK